MTTDLTFITNENGQSLKDRFNVLIKDSRFFDVLSGYFYTSGFYAIYKSLENTEKVRILVGISTDKKAFDLFSIAKEEIQQELPDPSHKEAKDIFVQQVASELENSQDSQTVEQGVMKFIEWIENGKLEIKVYPSQNIHAKVYIVTFKEGDRDTGRVITGSSNLTQSGLVDNLEFNVELKNSADYHFAKDKFDTIYTFNFFPTTQSNNEIKLKEAAEAKINAFLTLLGGDAALLTDGEPIGSHELFNRLVSKKTITGEDEGETSELKYLSLIKNIRDNNADLFEKIKRLPKKGRSAKQFSLTPAPLSQGEGVRRTGEGGSLVTYFRKGKVQKFFKAGNDPSTGAHRPDDFSGGQGLPREGQRDLRQAGELDFISAAEILESEADEKKQRLPETYFDLLNKNKDAFLYATTEDGVETQTRRGQDSGVKMLKLLKMTFKNTKQLTEDQEDYLKKVMSQLDEGGLPKQTTKITHKALQDLGNEQLNPLKVLAVLQTRIPARLLESHYAEENPRSAGKREVILSMYLSG